MGLISPYVLENVSQLKLLLCTASLFLIVVLKIKRSCEINFLDSVVFNGNCIGFIIDVVCVKDQYRTLLTIKIPDTFCVYAVDVN